MEPKILLVGRPQSTLDVLSVELKRMGRQVLATNKIDEIIEILKNAEADLVVIGAGIKEDEREEMIEEIRRVNPQIPIYPFVNKSLS